MRQDLLAELSEIIYAEDVPTGPFESLESLLDDAEESGVIVTVDWKEDPEAFIGLLSDLPFGHRVIGLKIDSVVETETALREVGRFVDSDKLALVSFDRGEDSYSLCLIRGDMLDRLRVLWLRLTRQKLMVLR